jgi:hypothetical protein
MNKISKFGNFDGFELGVLIDGIPFASAGGLAVLCGVTTKTITDVGQYVDNDDDKFRSGKIANLLTEYDYQGDKLYEILLHDGQEIYAYSEPVCMAFLEYYAYEAGKRCTQKAKNLARALMRKSFKDFVYELVGYKETKRSSFSEYVLSRFLIHHDVDEMRLPDGYFCLFDKMIELLQKFDLSIDYVLSDQWYDVSKGDVRFLEPDISLGQHFSQLFTSDVAERQSIYDNLYVEKLSKNYRKFWDQKLIDAKWRLDKAITERDLRIKYIKIESIDSSLPIPENLIDRKKYKFNPSPDSNRKPEDVEPAYCYSNDYTSLFYEWLRDVFFKYVWRKYILDRDPDGWMQKYNKFKSLPDVKQKAILQTAEGKMISGFEYRQIWEKQLPPGGE